MNTTLTESSSRFRELDKMSVHDLLAGINEEDAKVAAAVGKAIPQIEALVNKIMERLPQGGRVFYLGAGTSGRLGVLDASEIPPTYGVKDVIVGLIAGGDTALRRSVENAEDDCEKAWHELQAFHIGATDTVIGIAASGTTPYVVSAVEKARANRLLTGCITCNPGSPLAQAAAYPVEVAVGAEVVTGSTRMKSGTAQKLVLNMISTTLMIRMGRVKGNKMVNMQLANHKLRKRGIRMIEEELGVSEKEAQQLLLSHGSVKKALDVVAQSSSCRENL
ncbi:MAG: N-acetylmuramic acid 6-phosphate etherase [Bacteroidales bacterium]|jgi:N-acetylmuramic acid 6-phosphate etherase|nr:N-acetylmuramic acid 6-phosphate etherase [Bacteroidales bacterium]